LLKNEFSAIGREQAGACGLANLTRLDAAHESLSREMVRRRLAENHLKPWRKDMCCIPQVDADYVARARSLCRAARPEAAGGLLRREPDPADRRGAPVPPAPGRIER
jgi:hypothetical protein